MAFQYIHTSAKRGLEPGQSGFCCVARDRDTPPDLILELERQSCYENTPGAIKPIALKFSIIATRTGVYHTLTCIQDSGIDYSKRDNHIAHHLCFLETELTSLPDPATILLHWKGWRTSWKEPPRTLAPKDAFAIKQIDARAAIKCDDTLFPELIVENAIQSRCLEINPGAERLAAQWYKQTLQRIPASERWTIPFTTCLHPSDKPNNFVWSCLRASQNLPYELSLEGRDWKLTNRPEAIGKPIPVTPPSRIPPKAPFKDAPIVEIPKELDRRSKRRPKRKWTNKRFNKAINFTIASLTGVCLCVGAYYAYYYQQEGPERLKDQSKTAGAKTQLLNASPAVLWESLVAQSQLITQNDTAWEIAGSLSQTGDNRPVQVLTVLKDLGLDSPKNESRQAIIPSSLLHIEYTVFQLAPELEKIVSQVDQASTFWLLPRSLENHLSELATLVSHSEALNEESRDSTFSSDKIVTRVRKLRQAHRDELLPRNQATLEAIQSHSRLKEEILGDAKLAPLLTVHEIFDAGHNSDFLGLDSYGIAQSRSRESYCSYLVSQFEDFILPQYDKFTQTREFTIALSSIKGDSSAPRSIYRAMQAALPNDARLALSWSTIESQWRQRFIRNDLMEETLISFSIERLDKAKQALLQQQRHFTEAQCRDFLKFQQIDHLVAEIERLAPEANLNQEWIVIRQQNNQLTTSKAVAELY